MRTLVDCFEGLLDTDFDITDDVLSIEVQCKRVKNDLYNKPTGTALNQLKKCIKDPGVPESKKLNSKDYTWIKNYPECLRLCDWICAQPKEWLVNDKEGEFYIAFCNHCLTDAGAKKKWQVSISEWGGLFTTYGKKVTIKMLVGTLWHDIVRLAIEP